MQAQKRMMDQPRIHPGGARITFNNFDDLESGGRFRTNYGSRQNSVRPLDVIRLANNLSPNTYP